MPFQNVSYKMGEKVTTYEVGDRQTDHRFCSLGLTAVQVGTNLSYGNRLYVSATRRARWELSKLSAAQLSTKIRFEPLLAERSDSYKRRGRRGFAASYSYSCSYGERYKILTNGIIILLRAIPGRHLAVLCTAYHDSECLVSGAIRLVCQHVANARKHVDGITVLNCFTT